MLPFAAKISVRSLLHYILASFVFICCTGQLRFDLMWKGCGSFSSPYCTYWRCICFAYCSNPCKSYHQIWLCFVTVLIMLYLRGILCVSCSPVNVLCFFLCMCFFAFVCTFYSRFVCPNLCLSLGFSANKPEYFSTCLFVNYLLQFCKHSVKLAKLLH